MKPKYSAVLLDLNGTILDNEAEWEEAFVGVISNNGLQLSDNFRLANGWWHEPGIGVSSNWKRLIVDPLLAEEYAIQTKDWYSLNKVDEDQIQIRDGVDELLERIKEIPCLTALCTSSTWTMVEEELEQLSLVLAFDVTTTGDEVLLPKPDPEIFLLTTQKLGIEPEECLVIEDSIAGVKAAVDAGCKVIGLGSEYAPEEMLKAAGASWVIGDLAEAHTILLEEMAAAGQSASSDVDLVE